MFKLGASGDMTAITAGDTSSFVRDTQEAFRPVSVAVDTDGDVYLVDDGDHSVRRINSRTGIMTTVLGPPPRSPYAALLKAPNAEPVRGAGGPDDPVRPWGLAVDGSGDLFVTDRTLHSVFRIRRGTERAELIAGCGLPGYAGDGGRAVEARLDSPQGLAVGADGAVFVADRGNHCVRRIDTRTGVITTAAGTGFAGNAGDGGRATSAELRDPVAVALDARGNLYIADLGNARVRRVARQTGVLSTPPGLDHVVVEAVAIEPGTGALVAGDVVGRKVLRRGRAGAVTAIAGNGFLGYAADGGKPRAAYLARPAALGRDARGDLYVAESSGHRVRRIDLAAGLISTVAGTGLLGFSGDGGSAVTSALYAPEGLAFDHDGRLLIADTGNHRVRRVARDGTISTVAGSGLDGLAEDGQSAISSAMGRPTAVAVDPQGALIVVQGRYGLVHRIDAAGKMRTIVGSRLPHALRDGAPATSGRIESISAFALGPSGSIFFAEGASSRVWSVDPHTGVATVVAGRGISVSGVTLGWVRALATDAAGNLYIGEHPDGIRRFDATRGKVTTILNASVHGVMRLSSFIVATGALYVTDESGLVKRLEADGRLTTIAGGGSGF